MFRRGKAVELLTNRWHCNVPFQSYIQFRIHFCMYAHTLQQADAHTGNTQTHTTAAAADGHTKLSSPRVYFSFLLFE